MSRFFQIQNPKKTVYLMSFGNNLEFIKELAKRDKDLLVLYRSSCSSAAILLKEAGIKTIVFNDDFNFAFKTLQYVMGARLLFCDNYYAFLAGCKFNHHRTKVIQVWHANGAIKAFGWQEPRTMTRSSSDKKRFQKVYNQFDEYIVASKTMGSIFSNSYHVAENKMKVLGYPRSDRLFNADWQVKTTAQIMEKYPIFEEKEVILYAPTYREDEFGEADLQLPKDFIDFAKTLSSKQCLIIKLHPHLRNMEKILKKKINVPQIVWVDDFSTEDLLLITNRLITDYSSVAFDYTLLKNAGQIIFYCFDLDKYAQHEGLQSDWIEYLPGPLIKTAPDLSKYIQEEIQTSTFKDFNNKWNSKNDGHATKRVLDNYFKNK